MITKVDGGILGNPPVRLEAKKHPGCFVCGHNRGGLQLDFRVCPDGSVETFFCASAPFQGYTGFLHGGIIASLLDGAMTNCLFCQGKVAMTAELSVRYLKPIPLDQILTIRSWIEKSRSRLYILKAEITSHENLWAQGIGKFMEKPRIENTREPTRPANPICFQILLPP